MSISASGDVSHISIPNILFVDDESGVLSALMRLFHDEPYRILTANSGGQALSLMQSEQPFQLIVSDYRMPCMNGVEFLCRAMQISPDSRRVILSAYPDTDVLLEAVNQGRIHRFIVKPWDNEACKIMVAELLEEYRLLVDFRLQAELLVHKNRLLSQTNENLSIMMSELLANMRTATNAPLQSHERGIQTYQSKFETSHQTLSPRELQILKAIAAGQPLKAIALDLSLSIKTVSTYKKRMSEKMGFKHDAELIGYALTHNLL